MHSKDSKPCFVSSLSAYAQTALPGMSSSPLPLSHMYIHCPGLSSSFALTMKPDYLVSSRLSWPLFTCAPTETAHFPSRALVTPCCLSVFVNQTVSFLIVSLGLLLNGRSAPVKERSEAQKDQVQLSRALNVMVV